MATPAGRGERTPCSRKGGRRIIHKDIGHNDVENVRDTDGIAGTDDLDRGLRQRRFPDPDRELR